MRVQVSDGQERGNITMKKISLLLLCIFLISLLTPMTAVLADTEVYINNSFVRVGSGTQGGFGIRTVTGNPNKNTDDNKPLLYMGDGFNTSYTTVRIDGEDYIYGNRYGIDGTFETLPAKTDEKTISSVWKIDGVEVTQLLVLETNPDNSNAGNVRVYYSAKNTTGSAKSIGIRVLLDSAIGEFDGAPYYYGVEGMPVFTETTSTGADIPELYRCADSYFSPTTMAYGFLYNWGNVKPDRITSAHWSNLANTKWEYTPNSSIDFASPTNIFNRADSAMAIYFNEKPIAPNSSMEAETYYGIGEFMKMAEEDTFQLKVYSNDELKLNAAKNDYENNIINVYATVDNSFSNSKLLEEVTLTARLEEGMEFASGETAIKYTSQLARGDEKTAVWRIKVNPSVEYTAKNVMISAHAKGYEHDTIETKMFVVPSCSGLGPEFQVDEINPSEIYPDGISNVTLKGKGFSLLEQKGDWSLYYVYLDGRDEKELLVDNKMISVKDNNSIALDFEGFSYVGEIKLLIRFNPGNPLRSVFPNGLYFNKPIVTSRRPELINKNYGFIAITRDASNNYTINSFDTESAFDAHVSSAGEKNIMLTLKGAFREAEGVYRASSPGDTIIINNVVRYNGAEPLEVKKDNGKTLVTGNGKLDVIGALTFWKWSWKFVFNDGVMSSLYPDELSSPQAKPVYIQLDTFLGYLLQNINGFVINIKYGQFLKYEKDNVKYQAISFGGSLHVSFLGGKKKDQNPSTENNNTANRGNENDNTGGNDNDNTGGNSNDNTLAQSANVAAKKSVDPLGEAGGFSIDINEIRFGERPRKDNGFIGIDTKLALKLPDDALPPIVGGKFGAELEINTIDNKYGVAFEAELKNLFEVEGAFRIVLFDGKYPCIDTLYFGLGIDQGVPIIPGIVSATKFGMGFEGLADTLSGQFDVFPPVTLKGKIGAMVLESVKAEGAVEVGGQHFSLDLKAELRTGIVVVDGKFYLHWADPFNGKVQIGVNILDCVIAEGGIAFTKNYFKGIIRGAIIVPKIVPIIGGFEVASGGIMVDPVSVGAYVSFIGIPFGFIYYYGHDLEWITKSDIDRLFQFSDLKMDGNTGKGDNQNNNNRSINISSVYHEETFDNAGNPITAIYGTNLIPMMNLGAAGGVPETINIPAGYGMPVLKITYAGDTKPNITVKKPDNSAYSLIEPVTTTGENGLPMVTNENVANTIHDLDNSDSNGNYSTYISVRNTTAPGNWTITADRDVTITLINTILPAEISDITTSNTGSDITVNWNHKNCNADTTVSIYAVAPGEGPEEYTETGMLLEEGIRADLGTYSVSIPDYMPSDIYKIRVVAYGNGMACSNVISTSKITFLNPHQKPAFNKSDISFKPVGNGKLSVTAPDDFYAELFNEDGTKAGIFAGKGKANEELILGGKYNIVDADGNPTGETSELIPGEKYYVEVCSAATVGDAAYLSLPVKSDAITLPEINKPIITVTHKDMFQKIFDDATGGTSYVAAAGNVGLDYEVDQDDCVVSAEINEMKYGVPLDGKSGEVLFGAEDGDYVVIFRAINKNGDEALEIVSFIVEAAPPILKLETPEMGGSSNPDGSINVKGITNIGSTVTVNGEAVSVSDEGNFIKILQIPEGQSKMKLEIVATNYLGKTTKLETTILNGAVGALNRLTLTSDTSKPALNQAVKFTATVYDSANNPVTVAPYDIKWEILGKIGSAAIGELGDAAFNDYGEYAARATYVTASGHKLQDVIPVTLTAPPRDKGQNPNPVSPNPPGGGSTGGGGVAANPLRDLLDKLREALGNNMIYKAFEVKKAQDNNISFSEANIFIPKGGIAHDDTLLAASLPREYVNVSGLSARSGIYDVALIGQGTALTGKSTITLRFNNADMNDSRKIGVYKYNSNLGKWTLIDAVINIEAGTATFEDNYLGRYMVAENLNLFRFEDMPGRWSEKDVMLLASAGIVNGVDIDGLLYYQPERNITRVEFVKLLVSAKNLNINIDAVKNTMLTFTDNSEIPDWSLDYLKAAVCYGLLKGNDNSDGTVSMSPNSVITREEAFTLLQRTFFADYIPFGWANLADESEISDYAISSIRTLVELGIVKGYEDNTVKPKNNMSREEAASIFARSL